MMMRTTTAFTIIEMVIVLIMIGFLTATLTPLLLRQHASSLERNDRVALEDAKTAIIGYATSFGGIPNPLDMAGTTLDPCIDTPIASPPLAGGTGMMPWVTPPFPPTACARTVAEFGVNNWGVFGKENPFRMDVNDALKSGYINAQAGNPASFQKGQKQVFCQAVNAEISAPGSGPRICQDIVGDHSVTACPPSSTVPAAFVIYSTGNDRKPDQENDETAVNRIYENDTRGINNSNEPGSIHYDDQVMSYPLTALARDCRERMNVLPEVMGCAPGQKYLALTNLTSPLATFFYTVNGNATWLAVFTPSPVSGCQPRLAAITLCATDPGSTVACPAPIYVGGAVPTTMAQIDAGGDGRADVVVVGTAPALSATGN